MRRCWWTWTWARRVKVVGANQYRIFRFEASGAIKAAFVFLKMDESLAAMEAETLALAQAVQVVVLAGDARHTRVGFHRRFLTSWSCPANTAQTVARPTMRKRASCSSAKLHSGGESMKQEQTNFQK